MTIDERIQRVRKPEGFVDDLNEDALALAAEVERLQCELAKEHERAEILAEDLAESDVESGKALNAQRERIAAWVEGQGELTSAAAVRGRALLAAGIRARKDENHGR